MTFFGDAFGVAIDFADFAFDFVNLDLRKYAKGDPPELAPEHGEFVILRVLPGDGDLGTVPAARSRSSCAARSL